MTARIVSIRECGKKERYLYIKLSDGQTLKLNPEVAIGSSFYIGRKLTENVIKTLKKNQSQQDTYSSALKYITRRAHSRGELYDKLYNKGFPKDDINQSLNKLDKQGYINDEDFARIFVRDRIQKGKYGTKLIAAELFKKRVRKAIIDKVLHEELSGIDQSEIAYELLLKRALRYTKYEGRELKARLYRYLQGRGFDGEDIIFAVNRLLEKK